MWQSDEPVTEDMLHKAIYEELKRVASRQAMTTYSDIAPLAVLDMENPADRDAIRLILGKISTYEHQKDRPMLTAIVVHRQDNIPGHGFFELARHLGRLKEGADELSFFCWGGGEGPPNVVKEYGRKLSPNNAFSTEKRGITDQARMQRSGSVTELLVGGISAVRVPFRSP